MEPMGSYAGTWLQEAPQPCQLQRVSRCLRVPRQAKPLEWPALQKHQPSTNSPKHLRLSPKVRDLKTQKYPKLEVSLFVQIYPTENGPSAMPMPGAGSGPTWKDLLCLRV